MTGSERLLRILAAKIYADNRPRSMRKPSICYADLAFLPLTEQEKAFCMKIAEKLAEIDLKAHTDREFFEKIKKKTLFEVAVEVEL
ncbi:MAG: hypothetical protein J7K59_04510 [Candidatus Korarchaeota archaeon]|nr:hypothetical protein [Candidatus Korarchaeota archaeon]